MQLQNAPTVVAVFAAAISAVFLIGASVTLAIATILS